MSDFIANDELSAAEAADIDESEYRAARATGASHDEVMEAAELVFSLLVYAGLRGQASHEDCLAVYCAGIGAGAALDEPVTLDDLREMRRVGASPNAYASILDAGGSKDEALELAAAAQRCGSGHIDKAGWCSLLGVLYQRPELIDTAVALVACGVIGDADELIDIVTRAQGAVTSH